MSRPQPRRRADPPPAGSERPGREAVFVVDDATAPPTSPASPTSREPRTGSRAAPGPFDRVAALAERVAGSRVPLVGLLLLVTAGLVALVAALVPVGPEWLGRAGSVAVVTAYSWALAARTGGRPVVAGTLALVLGLVVVLTDVAFLRTGAAVLTSAIAAVLAVMVTVPAVTSWRAARECVLAVVVAGIGALAVVGFEPVVDVVGFEYVTLGLALAGALGLVVRLGAGFHGLGRRGVVVVAVGGVVLIGILVYAEVLRRYGSISLTQGLLEVVDWSRDTLGASPRPLEAVLGVPALGYGCHVRARRRQGWWVCAFGVAGTTAVVNALVPPGVPLQEVGLSVLYGLVVGLVLGMALIRLDLAVTGGGRGSRGSRGRRSRVAEQATAVRPEPPRTRPLL